MFNDPRVWLALALAFILGWLVDWLFEILFWRGRRLQADGKMLRQKLAVQEARLRELEQALNTQRAAGNGARVTQLTEELRAARSELAEAQQLLTRQTQELDALRVAQATADAETPEPLPAALDEPALPDAILPISEEEGENAARDLEPEPPARSSPAQTTAPSHRLDDEARRVAALLSGRPYEPPSSPALRAEEPTSLTEEASPIPIDELTAAPALRGPLEEEMDTPPTATSSEAEVAAGATDESQTESHAGSDVGSTEKKPRSRRRSR